MSYKLQVWKNLKIVNLDFVGKTFPSCENKSFPNLFKKESQYKKCHKTSEILKY
jgi:hypothetical protein